MKARNTNAAGVEYAAMAVANSALRAVPGGLAQRADLLGNISDSDSSPATRQRSDASNATSDDDDRSIESFDDKKNSGSGGHSSEDYTDDEDEGEEGYKPGGYHPVKLGEVYNQRYVVIKKLGWGHFSTVWMVKDRKLSKASSAAGTKEKQFFALKVQKSAEHYTEAAIDEVALLDCVATERKKCEAALLQKKMDTQGITMKDTVEHAKHVATLHDSFFHTGPNGRHMVMVFSMLGCNLLSVIKAYNYRGIPIPVVKNMIRGMCMGLDFLHRKCSIIHTDLKPENVLLQFPNQMMGDIPDYAPAVKSQKPIKMDGNDPLAVSIADLEKQLQDTSITAEERKRIRNRLKKKRRKQRKRTGAVVVFQDGSDDGSDEEDGDEDDEDDEALDDFEMESLLGSIRSARSPQLMSPNGPDGELPPPSAFQRGHPQKLDHSAFVACNFGHRQVSVDSKISHVMRDVVEVSRASLPELSTHLENQKRYGRFAQVSFLVRSFTPEEELADILSQALGGVPWEKSKEAGATREWRCALSMTKPNTPRHADTSDVVLSTTFKLLQRGRKDMSGADRQAMSELAQLTGANLSEEPGADAEMPDELTVGLSPRGSRTPPFSVFTAQFSSKATFVVLSFLESRLPGVVFLTYKRMEGSPQLDSLVFGDRGSVICSHPLAMRIKADGMDPNANPVASCIFGFDLRLVKDFAARPTVGEDGSHSFQLDGNSVDQVTSWWKARNPVQDRVQACTGVDPSVNMLNVPGMDESRQKVGIALNADDFVEGSKFAPKLDSPANAAILSRASSLAAADQVSSTPDLRDANMLQRCRAVVVDLGNACWTHRHFSEDIQTRQYRAPEVIIGSKYDTSADLWSLACITFELLTGDLLFDPRAGEDYDRDEDHLAMFQELLGKMPKRLALSGKYSKNFFDKKGNLKHIKQLKFWPVQDVLKEKYHFKKEDAEAVADFMMPMLEFEPKSRATALDVSRSKWLKTP
jgi:serine/threonine protein kinase